MFSSMGKIAYFKNPYKIVVEIDQELSNYYFSLIPKHYRVRKQMYPAHVTVLRNEEVKATENWGKYSGALCMVDFENFIYNDELYYWLNAYCPLLETIRRDLGLSHVSDFTKSPDGQHRFHMTLGNMKVIK